MCPSVLQCPLEKTYRTVGFFLESFHTVMKGREYFPSLLVFLAYLGIETHFTFFGGVFALGCYGSYLTTV